MPFEEKQNYNQILPRPGKEKNRWTGQMISCAHLAHYSVGGFDGLRAAVSLR